MLRLQIPRPIPQRVVLSVRPTSPSLSITIRLIRMRCLSHSPSLRRPLRQRPIRSPIPSPQAPDRPQESHEDVLCTRQDSTRVRLGDYGEDGG